MESVVNILNSIVSWESCVFGIAYLVYDLIKTFYKPRKKCPNCNKTLKFKTEHFDETKYQNFCKSTEVIHEYCSCGWCHVNQPTTIQTAAPITDNFNIF